MEKHICHTCGNSFVGNYCNNCGEKVYAEKDKSAIHFFDDAIHFITHLDGTLFNSLTAIFTKPGLLSLEYCNGIRRKYFKPLSLFLLLVVLYLLFPLFEGLNMRLQYYVQNDIYGGFALHKVSALMKSKALTFPELSTLFHERSEKISKFLLIIIIPLNALLLWVCFFKKRKYYFDHLVLSTEINCFYLMWGFMIVPLLTYIINLIWHFISGHYLIINGELIFGIIIYSLVAYYTTVAVKRFYDKKNWQSILFGLLFIVIHTFIIQVIYKFILFVFTIYQI